MRNGTTSGTSEARESTPCCQVSLFPTSWFSRCVTPTDPQKPPPRVVTERSIVPYSTPQQADLVSQAMQELREAIDWEQWSKVKALLEKFKQSPYQPQYYAALIQTPLADNLLFHLIRHDQQALVAWLLEEHDLVGYYPAELRHQLVLEAFKWHHDEIGYQLFRFNARALQGCKKKYQRVEENKHYTLTEYGNFDPNDTFHQLRYQSHQSPLAKELMFSTSKAEKEVRSELKKYEWGQGHSETTQNVVQTTKQIERSQLLSNYEEVAFSLDDEKVAKYALQPTLEQIMQQDKEAKGAPVKLAMAATIKRKECEHGIEKSSKREFFLYNENRSNSYRSAGPSCQSTEYSFRNNPADLTLSAHLTLPRQALLCAIEQGKLRALLDRAIDLIKTMANAGEMSEQYDDWQDCFKLQYQVQYEFLSLLSSLVSPQQNPIERDTLVRLTALAQTETLNIQWVLGKLVEIGEDGMSKEEAEQISQVLTEMKPYPLTSKVILLDSMRDQNVDKRQLLQQCVNKIMYYASHPAEFLQQLATTHPLIQDVLRPMDKRQFSDKQHAYIEELIALHRYTLQEAARIVLNQTPEKQLWSVNSTVTPKSALEEALKQWASPHAGEHQSAIADAVTIELHRGFAKATLNLTSDDFCLRGYLLAHKTEFTPIAGQQLERMLQDNMVRTTAVRLSRQTVQLAIQQQKLPILVGHIVQQLSSTNDDIFEGACIDNNSTLSSGIRAIFNSYLALETFKQSLHHPDLPEPQRRMMATIRALEQVEASFCMFVSGLHIQNVVDRWYLSEAERKVVMQQLLPSLQKLLPLPRVSRILIATLKQHEQGWPAMRQAIVNRVTQLCQGQLLPTLSQQNQAVAKLFAKEASNYPGFYQKMVAMWLQLCHSVLVVYATILLEDLTFEPEILQPIKAFVENSYDVPDDSDNPFCEELENAGFGGYEDSPPPSPRLR